MAGIKNLKQELGVKTKTKSLYLYFRLTEDDARKLVLLSGEKGLTVSALLREIVQEYLERR
jgi:predicted DNA-binding protein